MFFLLERNALVTISPQYDKPADGASRFRWGMHVSLPFPFPSKACVHESPTIKDVQYDFSIHNHYDRLFAMPKGRPGMPQIWLRDRNKPPAIDLDHYSVNLEILQSVAIFREMIECASPNEAFSAADTKIKACLDYLSEYLGRRQTAAPYLTAWLVYPISLFDVGTVYHSVESFCENHQAWHTFASAPAIRAYPRTPAVLNVTIANRRCKKPR